MENNALVISDPQSNEMQLLKRTLAPDLTPDEFAMFLQYCKHTGFNPFMRQVYATKRQGRVTFQTGIDAFRARADETGKYHGQFGPFWCGPDGKWVDVWLATEPPAAAKVGVLRSDFKEPIWAIAKYVEYVQMTKDDSGSYRPNAMWKKMPANQLAKCAEALAIRKAFPEKLGGMYTDDEMQQADAPAHAIAPEIQYPDDRDGAPKDLNPTPEAPVSQKGYETKPKPRSSKLSAEAQEKLIQMGQAMVDAAYGNWTAKHLELRIKKGEVLGDKLILDEVQKDYDAFLAWKNADARPAAANDDIPF